MNNCSDHKLNVNVPAGIVRGARAAALVRMMGRGEFTDGALAVRWRR